MSAGGGYGPQGCCGLSGEMVKHGDSWDIGCNKCTCNGYTGKVACAPNKCENETIFSENERKVFGDTTKQSGDSCCGYCEPLTCRHNGTEYKMNDSFRDTNNPCIVYACNATGLTAWADTCPKQTYCTKDRRTYDEFGCSYTCNTSCTPVPTSMELSITYADSKDEGIQTCSAFVKMAKCNGECKDKLRYDSDLHIVKNDCFCCKQTSTEDRNITLSCKDGSQRIYSYKHITSCNCSPCA